MMPCFKEVFRCEVVMIKGRLFFLIAAILFAIRVEAQTPFGLLGGVNRANFSVSHTDGNKDFDTFTGTGLGGWVDIRLGKKVFLRLEPMYLRKGAQYQLQTPEMLYEIQHKIAYWEVPAFLKLKLAHGVTHPYLMAGMTIGFRLDAKMASNYHFNNRFHDDPAPSDLRIFSIFDSGLGFGAGMNFKLGHESMFVQSRYVWGLINIRNDKPFNFRISGVSGNLDGRFRTRGMQIMAGVPLSLLDF
jgi:hypothetical protein